MNSNQQYRTMDEYILLFPEDIQLLLQKMRRVIREEVPEGVETISYQIPTVKVNGRNLVHFAAFKDHLSFFPTSHPVEVFEKELKEYKTSKGTIQFPLDKAIPFDLIRKIVRFRLEEVNAKK